MSLRRPLSLLGLATLSAALACGNDSAQDTPPAKTPPPTKADTPTPAPAAGSTSGGDSGTTAAMDPFATDDGWAETEAVATVAMGEDSGGSDDTGGEPAPTPLFDGPCYVRWNNGPVLRFRYTKDGGSGWLRIDGENDGKNDVCAKFWLKDKHTNKVTVDQGCDKSTDATISPKYEEGTNLATATYTDKSGDTEVKHDITLITLPAFTGVAPGYPLYAARDDIEFDIKDGLVHKATVKKTVEGPAVKVSLTYNDEGLVTRIDEDHKADGKRDRRYDYRYDEVGNVTGITLNETDYSEGKGKKSKKTAKLGYSCWAK